MTSVRLASMLAYSAAVLVILPSALRTGLQGRIEQPDRPQRRSEQHNRSAVQLELAAEVLRNAVAFDAPQIGVAGITPTEVLAWRVVQQGQAHDSIFTNLLATATPAGQLYALAGLRYSLYVVGADSSIYWSASSRLGRSKRFVPTMIGCIESFRPQHELVKEIDTGSWTSEFLVGHLRGER